MTTLVLDIETSKAYSFIGFYYPETDTYKQVEYTAQTAAAALDEILLADLVIFFNIKFDLPHLVLGAALGDGLRNSFKNPHDISHYLINSRYELHQRHLRFRNEKEFAFYKTVLTTPYKLPHTFVDVMPLASIDCTMENEIMVHKKSLKYFSLVYLGKTIQEQISLMSLQTITEEEKETFRAYNRTDLLHTWQIFTKLTKVYTNQKKLGDRFNINCTVSTNSSLNTIFLKKYMGLSELPKALFPKEQIYDDRYKEEPILQRFLDIYDKIEHNFYKCVTINLWDDMPVRLGFGGLHGIKNSAVIPFLPHKEGYILVDYDVTSQYPSIYTQLDNIFHPDIQKALKNIMIERKRLKMAGTDPVAAGAYKLILNSTYGKLGLETATNALYNRTGMLRVATGGQLMILYAILKLHEEYDIIYINTDGFTLMVPSQQAHTIPLITEKVKLLLNRFYTDIDIEQTTYVKAAFLNVNSYSMVDEHGGIKSKKDFKITSVLSAAPIISKLLLNYYLDIPIGEINKKDYVFIKTKKHSFDNGNKVALCYYSKTKADYIWNGSIGFINTIDELDIDDVDVAAYETIVRSIQTTSHIETYTEEEKNIMANSANYYLPVTKRGTQYKNFEYKIYHEDILEHNRFIVLNRPSNKCNYIIFK